MSQTREKKEVRTTGELEYKETQPSGRPVRRRFSVLERTVLITCTLRFLATLSALIGFAANQGTPSQDVPIVAVVSLAIIVLFASRIRWAPLASIPLAAYVLYDTFTQPFLLFDIANPKGPNGGQGFALFIAGVLALASTIIVLGCAIGAAVENYRQNSPRVPRWYTLGMFMVTGMVIGAFFVGAMAQPPSGTTASTNGVPTVHMGAGGFDQPSITISKGSKLLLVNDSSIEHVFFNGYWQNGKAVTTPESGAPVINNVALNQGSVAIGPFTTAGTYHIFCAIHQGMNLTIVVQ